MDFSSILTGYTPSSLTLLKTTSTGVKEVDECGDFDVEEFLSKYMEPSVCSYTSWDGPSTISTSEYDEALERCPLFACLPLYTALEEHFQSPEGTLKVFIMFSFCLVHS